MPLSTENGEVINFVYDNPNLETYENLPQSEHASESNPPRRNNERNDPSRDPHYVNQSEPRYVNQEAERNERTDEVEYDYCATDAVRRTEVKSNTGDDGLIDNILYQPFDDHES